MKSSEDNMLNIVRQYVDFFIIYKKYMIDAVE